VYSVIQHAPSLRLQSPVADEADPAPVLLVLSPALHNEQVVAPPSYAPQPAPPVALYCHTLWKQETYKLMQDNYFPNTFFSYISHRPTSLCNEQFYKKLISEKVKTGLIKAW